MILTAICAEVKKIEGMLRHERIIRGDLTAGLGEKFDSLIKWVAYLSKEHRQPIKLIVRLRVLWKLRYFKRQLLLSPCRRPIIVLGVPLTRLRLLRISAAS